MVKPSWLCAGSQKAISVLMQSSVATLLDTHRRINAISGQLVTAWSVVLSLGRPFLLSPGRPSPAPGNFTPSGRLPGRVQYLGDRTRDDLWKYFLGGRDGRGRSGHRADPSFMPVVYC